MALDWDEINKTISEAAEGAAARTDSRLASRISSLTRMTQQEVLELFPAEADAKRLAELMSIVDSSKTHNEKITAFLSDAEKFAGVVLTLLAKVV